MTGVISWWANNKVAANLLMIGIVLAGIVSFTRIERELDPFVEFPGAQITVQWLGASPQDIEEQIVVRLEEAVSRVNGIDRLWSESSEGLGQLWVIGDDDLDKSKFLQDLKREIDAISTFPSAAEPAQLRLFRSQDEIVRIAVRGEVDERILKRYAEKIRREIALLPSVPSVDLFGVREEEVSIEISEDALRRFGLTFSDIADAVRGTSVNISAGNIRTQLGDMQLRTRKLADTRSEFEQIVVRQLSNGAVITIGDVATVIDGFEQVNLMATVNGERTILVQVMSGPQMDIVNISREVSEYLEEERPSSPEGITLTVWEDQEAAYTGRIDTISSSFFSGLILVLITLMLFLRPIIALWVAIGIGVAFAGGIAFLPLFDVSFNMISSFAFLLVIGVIVDDAIIVGEAIHSKIEDGETGVTAAISGTKMVIMPVVFAVLTTMIFFAPWMMVGGGTAEFTRAISLVVILALTFSLVESLLILPAHLSHLKPVSPKNRLIRMQNKIADSVVWFARNVYRPAITAAVKRRYLTAMSFIAAMILSIGLLTNGIVRTSFMPEIESDQIEITVNLPQGTPYARTLEVLKQIQIAEQALVDEVNASTDGQGALIENWYTRSRDNQVLALVKLVPPETRSLTAKETAERLRELIGAVPDAETISVAYQNNNGGPPIEYVLNSENLEDLNAAADDLMEKLRSYNGVFNVVNDQQSSTQEIRFELKPGAEALGITTADVAQQVRQGFYGEEVQRLPRDGQDVRVFVRYPLKDRQSLDHLRNMRIRTSEGQELPLYTVANIEYASGITRILRRERQRAVIVSAEVVSERIDEIRTALDDDYFVEFDARHPTVTRGNIGRAQGQAEFMEEILILGLIAIGVAYFLIAVAFKSYFEPILILFAAIPFCFTGAMVGHLIMGLSLSLFSYLGIMAAAGVAVNDNLVLIDYINKLRDKGMDGAEALIEAGTKRFRPILLTSITTFVGLMPLMMEQSIQAKYLVPVGVGLSFGVLFALFVTLFFVPALYTIGADIRRFFIYMIKGVKQPNFDEKLMMPKAPEEESTGTKPALQG
ncbi:MAG: efflux RND transporter permease subunit [Marinicaulis sp.]|nr:efflux RND transporter permease subunit [Marinicaulis sp.]